MWEEWQLKERMFCSLISFSMKAGLLGTIEYNTTHFTNQILVGSQWINFEWIFMVSKIAVSTFV